MKLFGIPIWPARKAANQFEQIIAKLDGAAAYDSPSGIVVTPENCEDSPTVNAIITAVTNRFAATPIHVFQKSTKADRETKERLPNHPVARLLRKPNDWQTNTSYWLDSVSQILRYGNFIAFKGRGQTGPIRRLEPIIPSAVMVKQDDNLNVTYLVSVAGGGQRTYTLDQLHHVRLRSNNGIWGDSPVLRARRSIGLEIAMETFASAFFGNGASPSFVFGLAPNHKMDVTARAQFKEDFQALYGGKNRFRAMLLPDGIEMPRDPIVMDNDKNQLIPSRQFQRTQIAGAFNIPPHLVGDLTRGTFNNVEQQSIDFTQIVIQPLAKIFEDAMERDLLTDEDRARGVIIRFNLDAALRGDFASRQAGLKIQREAGVINPNDWREHEGMNPRTDPGGEEFWDQGPSGQGGAEEPKPGDEPKPKEGDDDPANPTDE